MLGTHPATLADVARRLKPPADGPSRLPRLILMTDRVRLPDPERAVAALPAGSAVILRETDQTRRRALARWLSPLCRRRRIRLLIAADWRLALAVGACGLHLPDVAVRCSGRRWRAVRRPGSLITAAAHSAAAIRRAAAAGADAVLLAPVFPTASHPDARMLGVLRFARWAGSSPLPVYALGGIDAARARRLLPARPAGFAAIGALADGHPRSER